MIEWGRYLMGRSRSAIRTPTQRGVGRCWSTWHRPTTAAGCAILIARLTAQLRYYVPEPLDETWGGLRHQGAHRERLLAETVSQLQQIRDLLECVWPASLDTAKQPFRSRTWLAGMCVVLARTGGDPTRLRRLGPARFEAAVRREVVTRQGKKPVFGSRGCCSRPQPSPGE